MYGMLMKVNFMVWFDLDLNFDQNIAITFSIVI